MYAIRLCSKDNDDLRRGTDNDDEMKMYETYRCKVNMWENSFDGNCIRLGCRIEAEFVPRPSLYSPINENEYNDYCQYKLCKKLLKTLTSLFLSIEHTICLPLSTCTFTETGFPIAGEHVYIPASEGRASWTTKKLDVISPFSVITLTPPRGES